jgi:Tfp pilus assembly protein PilO
MRASTKRILSIMISAILLIAVVVVYVKFIQPAYSEVQNLRGKIQARQNLLQDQSQAVSQVQNLISQLQNQNISQFQDQISLVLPTTESIPQALNQYQAIAQASGLSIQSASVSYLAIKPSTANINLAKGTGTNRFKLNVLGPYEAIKTFFEAIETNVRLTDLVSSKLSRTGQPGQNLFLNEMVVDSYYQPSN